MTSSYSVQISVARTTYEPPRQDPNPGNKTSRSHYKILSKSTEFFLRRLSMTNSYSVQNSVTRSTRGLYVKRTDTQ